MINKENIRMELKILTESTFDLKKYIEKRLQKYSSDNDNDFKDLKKYFADNVDIIQPKTPEEEEEGYLKIVGEFLSDNGY